MNQDQMVVWFGNTCIAVALIVLLLMLSGCVSMQEGEVKAIRTTTFGIILSYDPITNLPEFKLGWNEVQFVRSLKVKAKIEADHKDISIFTGSGTVHRAIDIGE